MGRAKSDPPEIFPWEKYFSFDQDLYDSANEQCQTTTSAEMVRKVLTTLGISFTGGDKLSNCLKINKEITMIKKKISKIPDVNTRNEMASKVANYFKNKFLDKIYPDRKIQVPAKPDLPRLTDDETKEINEKFDKLLGETIKTRALSPSRVPQVSSPNYIFDTSTINEDKILEAAMILYYNQVPLENNKKSLTKDGAVTVVKKLFKDRVVQPTSKLFNTTEIVKILQKVATQVKESSIKNIPTSVIDSAKSVIKDAINSLPKISSEEVEEKVVGKPSALPSIVQKRKYTKDDFIRVIKNKGWDIPSDDSSESLCDFILDKIQQEEPKNLEYQQQLENKITELEIKINSLIQQQEAKIIELEELKTMNNLNLESLEKKEKEIKSLEKKIQKLENELLSAQQQQQQVQLVQEDNRQVCFAMNDWLNQDSFDVSSAEQSMSCSDEKYPICNIDQQRCTDSMDSHSYEGKSYRITSSSPDKINKIKTKLTPPVVEEAKLPTPEPAKKKINSEYILEFIKNKLSKNIPIKMDDEIVMSLIQDFIKENGLKQDFIPKYKSAFTKLSQSAFDSLPKVVEPTIEQIEAKIKEIVIEQELKTLIGDLDDVVESLRTYLEDEFKYDFSSKKELIFQILENSVRNNISESDLSPYIINFINSNQIRKYKKQELVYLLNFIKDVFNIDFEPRQEDISNLYKQLIEQHKKQSSMRSCSTKDKYSSPEEAIQDLECPEGEVCDLVKGVCRIAEEDDTVEEIIINDVAVKVIGSENIINVLKEKIISSKVQPEPEVKLEEEIKEEPVIELEEVKEEPVIELEEVKEEPMPTVKVETPTLEDIVKNIKEITTEKKSVTTTQQKLKVAQQKAIERLRKCAGL